MNHEIQDLLRRWDARVRRDLSRFSHLTARAAARGSVLRQPARDAEIEAAERRIGAPLPLSYRAFLAVSDGADASSLGAVVDHRGHAVDHGLLGVDRVALSQDADAEHVELWTGIPELMDPRAEHVFESDEPVDVTCFARLAGGVLISTPMDTNREVLVPRPGVEEWELWSCHWSGALAHRSFADYLRWQLGRPDPRPDPTLADRYAADVRAGRGGLEQLAELGDPRAGDLAVEVLRTRNASAGAVTLQLLAESRFLPPLREALGRVDAPHLRFRLLAALEACGDPDIDTLLARELETTPIMHADIEQLVRWRREARP